MHTLPCPAHTPRYAPASDRCFSRQKNRGSVLRFHTHVKIRRKTFCGHQCECFHLAARRPSFKRRFTICDYSHDRRARRFPFRLKSPTYVDLSNNAVAAQITQWSVSPLRPLGISMRLAILAGPVEGNLMTTAIPQPDAEPRDVTILSTRDPVEAGPFSLVCDIPGFLGSPSSQEFSEGGA